MSTKLPGGAVNQRTTTIVEFDTDPHQPLGLFRDAWLRLHGFLVPVYSGGDTDPEGQFFGITNPQQDFRGMANPASASTVYRNGGNEEISSATAAGALGDPTARIFADRLRRRRA